MKKLKSVPVAEINGQALNWAVASVLGRAMRQPIAARDADVEHLKVPFTLFEVACTYRDGALVSARVRPITVERYGINTDVGATAPSITFRDEDGRRALGSVDMFYMTEQEAQVEVLETLHGGLEDFDPINDWSQGGPIIDKIGIMFYSSEGEIAAYLRARGTSGPIGKGATHLIAAMRCLVTAEKGAEIAVPQELVDQTA